MIGADSSGVIEQLQKEFSPACLDFADPLTDEVRETIAMQDDTILENYLSTGNLSDQTIQQLIKQRKVFPCYRGAALKLTGITNFLNGQLRLRFLMSLRRGYLRFPMMIRATDLVGFAYSVAKFQLNQFY